MLASGEFVIRLVLALGLGAMIGLERQFSHHEAGLKTSALVAAGSAMFVLMANSFSEPDRIVAQVVSGIGFLGAGVILRDGLHVRGLTTAATLWCAAAVGMLVGAGRWLDASLAAVLVVAANIVLRYVSDRIRTRQGGEEEGS
jgi:putative Mg2+ transporter-C (MgtC) family protein